jgi:hypothetical protein
MLKFSKKQISQRLIFFGKEQERIFSERYGNKILFIIWQTCAETAPITGVVSLKVFFSKSPNT